MTLWASQSYAPGSLAIEGLARPTIADYWLDVARAIADAAFPDRYFSKLAGADGKTAAPMHFAAVGCRG